MSAIAAVFNRNGVPCEREHVERMFAARPERGPDGQKIVVLNDTALGHQHFWLLPEELGEHQPLNFDDCLLSCDARLDNREQLTRLLGLDSRETLEQSDAVLILLSYQKWGVRCLSYLLGDFAFVIWDNEAKQLFLARDPLGARDICYYLDEYVCIVASEVEQCLNGLPVPPTLNYNRIAAFLVSLSDKPEETPFEQIRYLPPAHGMLVSDKRVKLWNYWDVDPDRVIRYKDKWEYAAHFRELVTEAVRCRLRTTGPVGVSLSGGLDSSMLAALVARMLPQSLGNRARLRSFSYVFNELKSCDERTYIQPIVDSCDLEPVYLPCDEKWPLRNLERWPVLRGSIFANPYAWLPITVMQAAKEHGIRMLVAGYYGDVLSFAQVYWALDMMRHGQFSLLFRTILKTRSYIRWKQDLFDSGLRQVVPPQITRAYRRLRPRSFDKAIEGVHVDLLTRSDARQRLVAENRQERFTQPGQWHRYRSLTLSTFSQGFAATRHMYNGYGMELVQPYYDRRLVEFVMAVPAYQLGSPDCDRCMHRESMRGLVPELVRLRGGFTDFTPLLLKGLGMKEKTTVKEILTDPMIVHEGFIERDWLRSQMKKPFDGSDDSMKLWNAVSLELWLKRYWS